MSSFLKKDIVYLYDRIQGRPSPETIKHFPTYFRKCDFFRLSKISQVTLFRVTFPKNVFSPANIFDDPLSSTQNFYIFPLFPLLPLICTFSP